MAIQGAAFRTMTLQAASKPGECLAADFACSRSGRARTRLGGFLFFRDFDVGYGLLPSPVTMRRNPPLRRCSGVSVVQSRDAND
jgi:hypothetical protein